MILFSAYSLSTSKSSLGFKCTLFQLLNGMLFLIICLVQKNVCTSACTADSVSGLSSLNSVDSEQTWHDSCVVDSKSSILHKYAFY